MKTSIDWSYDFDAHDWEHGGPINPVHVRDCVRFLKARWHMVNDVRLKR